MRIFVVILLAGLATILFFGCGDKGTDPQRETVTPPDTTTYDIQWSSTSVFYDTLIDKKDYSLIIFGAEWCGYCRMLDEQTLTDSTVAAIMNESFNCARIDIEADSTVVYFGSTVSCRQYADAHNVSGIPVTCILNRRGNMLGRIVGYYPADDYARYLDTIRNGAMGPPE